MKRPSGEIPTPLAIVVSTLAFEVTPLANEDRRDFELLSDLVIDAWQSGADADIRPPKKRGPFGRLYHGETREDAAHLPAAGE